MRKETVTMSYKELDRLQIIQGSVNRHITQEQAALRMGISVRQVKRLVHRYRNEGPAGLVSRRRGKRPNNAFTPEFKAAVISLHSIFRVNNPEREGELTQFTREIKTLGIEPIHANTPQAKGRVEGISDIETANAWLPKFIEAYNNRFATAPRDSANAHLDVHHSEEELNHIFSYQAKRVLSKNLTFQYKTSAFQIRSEGRGYRLRHSVVTVCENFEGEIAVLYEGRALGWEKYVDGPEPIPLDDEKSVHERVDRARVNLRSKYYVKPKADHPWQTRRTQSHEQAKPPRLPARKSDVDKPE